MEKHTIFITGGAGYVGAMLADQFSDREDVEAIVCVDKEDKPALLEKKQKVLWIKANLSDMSWQEEVKKHNPDIVIHTAWQIREMYGKKDLQWKWNITGSDNVFDFVFNMPSVKRFVHFSTVASYSAYPDNTIEHVFTEKENFRESDYLYAIEKAEAEKRLVEKLSGGKSRGPVPSVFVVRPAAITGPRGRYMRVRFGLQSALSGQLKGNFIYRIVSTLTSFTPVTEKWCRQFVHEDDINDIVTLLAFDNRVNSKFEIFNACPPGPVVLGKDMAEAVGKKAVKLPPFIIRIVFFLAWHLTHGKIPTSKGGWKSYCYPIVVDGSKITKMFGYKYRMSPKEAFVKKEGRYSKYIPTHLA